VIANTPSPPYYAVIFTSLRSDRDEAGYAETARKMEEMARRQPGFLGLESAREDIGISVSYWSDLESIRQWKSNLAHREAQARGREEWYSAYATRIARVERDYGM
jgi:heme-degrading monooxygenase HmoA